MILRIISTTATIFDGNVDSVTLPGAKGSFTVLNNHASLVSTLVEGNVAYSVGDNTTRLSIKGGLVDVDKNVVSICIF